MCQEGKIMVPKIGVRHRSTCTLKCVGCSSLFPQIKEHYSICTEQALRDLNLFFECVDECVAVGVSDGEPLLDKDLGMILEWCIQNPKILSISFNTNGTLLPQRELLPYLKSPKVFIRISDYGRLASMAQLVELFEKEHIQFKILSDMRWIDPGKGECYNRTPEELKYNFFSCENSKSCKILADGCFYDCERCFRMERLHINGYHAESDKIILKNFSVSNRRRAILDMYLKEHSQACNYCNLGCREANIIEAGIQENSTKRLYDCATSKGGSDFMDRILNNNLECYGCRGCEQICSTGSISMQSDKLGFLYP